MSSCGRRGSIRRGACRFPRINRYNPNDPDYRSVHFNSPFSFPFVSGAQGLLGIVAASIAARQRRR